MSGSFGVQGSSPLLAGAPDPGQYKLIAESAEASGFDSLWASDHVAGNVKRFTSVMCFAPAS